MSAQVIKLLSESDIIEIMKGKELDGLHWVKEAFIERSRGKVLLPDKISQVFDKSTQDRINCMPATLVDQRVCGVKWVSVFPSNKKDGKENLTGQIILSDIKDGFPISFMSATWLTAFRTAAVGAIASKLLGKDTCTRIGIIGSGKQAQMHFRLIKAVHPEIKECTVASLHTESELRFIDLMGRDYTDVKFINCRNDLFAAADGADIIVTATSTQAPLLKADAVKPGATYIHAAGYEDEYGVALKSSKIVCDEWESVKHRSQTLCLMYEEGILRDEDIYADLADIITGEKVGRESDDEIIYFNSVGMAYVDVYFAYRLHLEAVRLNKGTEYNIGE